ncbi:capsid cement protein [Jiangella muralis]|uniref:capsid cement protein n=1 Tax=Jiangella muralis TaxID=702383 RepID=UPI00069F436A|nr:capsid cement protein [Jiangella muralis]
MANDAIPLYAPGSDLTCKAASNVTGKRLVKVSGNGSGNVLVAHSGAGEAAFGVAGWDVATGQLVNVLREGVLPVTAGTNLTAGAVVQAGAAGVVVAVSTGIPIGTVVFDVASGADAFVAFNPALVA